MRKRHRPAGIHSVGEKVMYKQMESANREVVCLHYRMQTPLLNSPSPPRFAEGFITIKPKIALVRCINCGKEAPYLAEEILTIDRISTVALHAA